MRFATCRNTGTTFTYADPQGEMIERHIFSLVEEKEEGLAHGDAVRAAAVEIRRHALSR